MSHLSNRYSLDRELSRLNEDILKLGSLVENAIYAAVLALENRDIVRAKRIIVGDEEINRLRYELEDECVRVLATQSPTARDLRRVIATNHIATELERIGDHAAGIARLVERIDGQPAIPSLYQLPKMAKRARKMVRKSLQAFITQDADMAHKVIARDEKLDRHYEAFVQVLMAEMNETDTDTKVLVPTYMLWMGHNIERIGDRVTNIAERVIFMITGEFVEITDF